MMDLVAQVQMVCGDQNGTADISSDGPGSVLLEGIRFRWIIEWEVGPGCREIVKTWLQ